MKRPIGVTLLALLSWLAAASNLWRVGVYMGWFEFEIFGDKGVQLQDPNWGAAFWALLLAAIWIWVGLQFWNVRAAGWQFGTFISLFTLIWGFFALLFGSTVQYESLPMFLALVIYVYLQWPGVKEAFAKSEMDRLTPEQRAAYEQLAEANSKAGVTPPPGM